MKRKFERRVGTSLLQEIDGAPGRGKRLKYERLIQVSFRHGYYNASGRRCPDFQVRATPATADFMAGLGLLLRRGRTGFSVLIESRKKASLYRLLKREARPAVQGPCHPEPASKEEEVWTRLSFSLSLDNDDFVNFTAVPIDTNPAYRNFYFTNQNAVREAPDERVVLNPPPRGFQSLDLTPVQLAYRFPKGAGKKAKVIVCDIEKREVLCVPRCVPKSLADASADPSAISCEAALMWPEKEPVYCHDTVYVDFFRLPEGLYSLHIEDLAATSESSPARQVLYTVVSPQPFAFIDLLLARPTKQSEGVYPVVDLFGEPAVVPVDYELEFQTRSTFWNYFVVPTRGETLKDPRIRSQKGAPQKNFSGPCRVKLRLPGGGETEAFRFVSEEPLALEQDSRFRFELVEGPKNRERVLVDPLPVGSILQVLPLREGEVCASLVDSLWEGALDEPPCRDLVERLCEPAEADGGSASRRVTDYSDIYVYL